MNLIWVALKTMRGTVLSLMVGDNLLNYLGVSILKTNDLQYDSAKHVAKRNNTYGDDGRPES